MAINSEIIVRNAVRDDALYDYYLQHIRDYPLITRSISALALYLTNTIPTEHEDHISLLGYCVENALNQWHQLLDQNNSRTEALAMYMQGLLSGIQEALEYSIQYKYKGIFYWDPVTTDLKDWRFTHKQHLKKIKTIRRKRPFDKTLSKLKPEDYRLLVMSRLITQEQLTDIQDHIDHIVGRPADVQITKMAQNGENPPLAIKSFAKPAKNTIGFARKKLGGSQRVDQMLQKKYKDMLEMWPEIPRIVKSLNLYVTDQIPSMKMARENLVSSCVRMGFIKWQASLDRGEDRGIAFIQYLNGLLMNLPEILHYKIAVEAHDAQKTWDPINQTLTQFLKKNKKKKDDLIITPQQSVSLKPCDFKLMVIPKILNTSDINAILLHGELIDVISLEGKQYG